MNAAAEDLVAPLPGIELAALDRLAALQIRTERKYVVDLATLARLARLLAPTFRVLELGGRRTFGYDTIYFDTPDLTSYRERRQGRRRRFKCRTRFYGGTGACYFELKLKGGRGETVKRRLAVPPDDHGSLTPRTRDFLAAELAGHGVVAPATLVEALRTWSHRATLTGNAGGERVTCDFEFAVAAEEAGPFTIREGSVIVETKTLRGNGTADRALRSLGARPVVGCSKYCLGVALTHPRLPSNQFRRLLRRHFYEAEHA